MIQMSLRLVQRQELKQRQELQLKQTLKQSISLQQYLAQEDFIKGLIRFADENNSWNIFNKDGFNFEYALVPYEIAKPIAKEYGPAFTHCLYNGLEALFFGKKVALAKGSWIKFVVGDKVPKELFDYLALHERGEELSLGNHYFASKLEFAYSSKRKNTKKYVNYIDDNYPSKFIDLEEKVLFPILPEELIEYIKKQENSSQKQNELEIAEKIIEDYPMPQNIIKKMNKYSKETERVCKQINESVGHLQRGLFNIMSDSKKEYLLKDVVDYINKEISYTMKSLNVKNIKALSKPKIRQSLEILSNIGLQDIRKNIKSKITLEESLIRLIQKAKIGESLVTIEYTPEEKARMKN